MEYEGFRKHLKKSRKKHTVIDRNIQTVKAFQHHLNERNEDHSDISKEDIDLYVKMIEQEKKSAKGILYVLMNYFRYQGDQELYSYTSKLREERTKKSRRIFPLKHFLGIDPSIIDKLASIGITNVKQMLENRRQLGILGMHGLAHRALNLLQIGLQRFQ